MSITGWILAIALAGGAASLAAFVVYLARDFKRWWALTNQL